MQKLAVCRLALPQDNTPVLVVRCYLVSEVEHWPATRRELSEFERGMAVGAHGGLMIVTGGVWVKVSVRTDKQLWQKSHPHSKQEAPHTYPTGQCSDL